MRVFVVVYDICSSTRMLEDLATNDNLAPYEDLILKVASEFSGELAVVSPVLYKFLGDGGMYLLHDDISVDSLVKGLCEFVESADVIVSRFVKRHIEVELQRFGLTVGVAFGTVHKTDKVGTLTEYYGRPLNLASRLQGSLKEPDQSNKILVQKEVFQRLQDRELRRHFNLRKRIFRNINGDQPISCYEIDPYNEDLERNQT
jgi:class 3 adenylate cyclase